MYGIRLKVWGDWALFSRPELKVERYSYDVITPSAARGILDAIYWHPGLKWVVDKIYVVNPIQFTTIKRNEVKSKIQKGNMLSTYNSGDTSDALYTKKDIVQRSSVLLKNVEYVIDAHFVMTNKANPSDNEGKFLDIARRRAQRGQCYHQPCLGCREFPAGFSLYEDGRPVRSAYEGEAERDLGLMLYDINYETMEPMFFRAVMKNGVIDVSGSEIVR